MDKVGRGIVAGFLATLLLSLILDPIAMVARTAGLLPPTLGWLLLFLVGSLVWGAGFAILHSVLWGPCWLRGIEFGLIGWLLVLSLVPLTHGAPFALELGAAAAATLLVVHALYGALLGFIFDLLASKGDAPHGRLPLDRMQSFPR